MPYYPGDPVPSVKQFKSLDKDGVNLKEIHLGSHSGTHVDAPAHFVKDAPSLDQLDPMAYSGTAIAIKVDGIVKVTDVPPKGEIVLFYTGTNRNWRPGWRMDSFGYVEPEAAKELVKRGFKVVGIDSPSVEMPRFREPETHRTLLSNGVLIIENLADSLSQLVGKTFKLYCLPIKVREGDGAPARVVAVLD
ncbi:cyclase [Sulfodiicoccus acidiphilus]|uniref:Cyclase n=3 Tax=Sulfodiicoccus acidiphilus TaxID=1670455 RepID=A0A830H0M9_9CREN|nr:cyclase [Sulfodiicoccus acidiphilus]